MNLHPDPELPPTHGAQVCAAMKRFYVRLYRLTYSKRPALLIEEARGQFRIELFTSGRGTMKAKVPARIAQLQAEYGQQLRRPRWPAIFNDLAMAWPEGLVAIITSRPEQDSLDNALCEVRYADKGGQNGRPTFPDNVQCMGAYLGSACKNG